MKYVAEKMLLRGDGFQDINGEEEKVIAVLGTLKTPQMTIP